MTRPGFIEGALVALIAALGASILYTALRLLLLPRAALALTAVALGLGYLLYLLGRGGQRAGRVLPALLWVPASAAALALWPAVWVQAAVQLGLVWLVRAWHFQRGFVAALLDLALILSGAAAALWAAVHTGSLFLAVWCLFLVQALFGSIPDRSGLRPGLEGGQDPFDAAAQAAEGALGRLREQA